MKNIHKDVVDDNKLKRKQENKLKNGKIKIWEKYSKI